MKDFCAVWFFIAISPCLFSRNIDSNYENILHTPRLNASTDVWHFGVPMNIGRSNFGGAIDYDGSIYAIAGWTSAERSGTDSIDRFDDKTNTWEFISPFPYKALGVRATSDPDGNIYASGGFNDSDPENPIYYNNLFKYNKSEDSWTSLSLMSAARSSHRMICDKNGKIIVAGGRDISGITTNSVEMYDPDLNIWSALPSMKKPRACLALLVDSNNRLFAFGGSNNGAHTNTSEMYDPAYPENGWQYVSSLSASKLVQGTVGTDGKFYLCGGWLPGSTNAVDVYDPQTDQWSSYSPMNRKTNNMEVVTTDDGRIYVLGGDEGDARVEYTDLVFPTPTQTPLPNAPETWEPVYEGYYEGSKANLFHPSVERGKTAPFDMDGDGDLDLLIGGDHYIRYYRNDGTKKRPSWTIANHNLLNLPKNAEYHMLHQAVADFDSDGDPDIVASSWMGYVYYFRNEGNNEFTEVTNQIVQNMGWNTCLDAKDLDADGDYDIILTVGIGNPAPTQNSGKVFFVENTGGPFNPIFAAPLDIGFDSSRQNTRFVSLCDIDADGDFDLFFGEASSLNHPPYLFTFYRNTGTPENFSFSLEDSYYFPVMYEHIWLIPGFVDMDSDGDYDCLLFNISAYGESGFFGMMENTGSPINASWSLTNEYFKQFSYKHLNMTGAFGDLDDDGDLDMIQAGEFYGFGLFENTGSPVAPNWILRNEKYIENPNGCYCPVLCDIDGDNDLDFFAIKDASSPRGMISFWENTGTSKQPVFQLRTESWQGISSEGFATCYDTLCFGDINGDGAFDLLTGTGHSLVIYLYQNQGSETEPSFNPSAPVPIVTCTPPPGTYSNNVNPWLVDVDNDGDLDLFATVEGHWAQANYATYINFFRNNGNETNPNFVLETSRWNDIDLDCWARLSSGDIDGDGLPNMFFSGINGGMIQYRSKSSQLVINPDIVTLLPGETRIFDVMGAEGAVSLTLEDNRSSATLIGNLYTAGNVTGVIDKIKATDSASLKIGFAYINVISPSQLSASGKAVIMAGRKAIDPLWQTTNKLAHSVFQTLLYRGFSKENIFYMNPEPNQDADGNGNSADDIDAPSSLTNIETALSTFAPGSPNLFIYLIDHGDADENGENGAFQCNETETLSAAQLDSLLDNLQENEGVTTLTLVVDCCQAGAFIKQCSGAPPGKTRIVISSAGSLEPAFFSTGGLVSFTNGLLCALYSGHTLGNAFVLAQGAMDPYQKAQIDDDGDGNYNKDLDGEIADRISIGASFIAGADRPQIGKICPNQSLTTGTTSATIWASEVSSVYPISRVWACIAPPNLIPESGQNPGIPIQNLPQLELEWNIGNERYEATTDTFTQLGAYAVNIYAQDIWQSVSYPKQTYVNQNESDEEIIIVCGDGSYDSNSPWEFSDFLANQVYETASARWLVHDKIAYLSSSLDSRVDAPPTKSNLLSEISAATGITRLTVYLVGKGNATSFDIDGDGSDGDDLTPGELDTALDTLQNAGDTCVIVLLDFTDSGSWVSPLKCPPGKKRIVIGSCSAGEASWCEEEGMISFSRWFMGMIFSGTNIRDAFNWARAAIRKLTGSAQNPGLDDDGSGVADGWDGALAGITYIGAAFVTGDNLPVIKDYAKDIVLSGSSEVLWASGVWDADGISEVFAFVIKPGASSSNDQIDKLDLIFNSASARWEALCTGFDPAQDHTIVYMAKDKTGDISEPSLATFKKTTISPGWFFY